MHLSSIIMCVWGGGVGWGLSPMNPLYMLLPHTPLRGFKILKARCGLRFELVIAATDIT
jgi:hypothetical protein